MGHRVFELDGRIYALGGQDVNTHLIPMDHFSVFDPSTSTCSRQEIQGTEIPMRAFFSIGLIGRKLYIIGGRGENGRRLNDLFVVDLTSFDCKKLDTLSSSARSHCLDWCWEKKLFLMGGTTERYGDSRYAYVLDITS